jgi:hypothetical protein
VRSRLDRESERHARESPVARSCRLLRQSRNPTGSDGTAQLSLRPHRIGDFPGLAALRRRFLTNALDGRRRKGPRKSARAERPRAASAEASDSGRSQSGCADLKRAIPAVMDGNDIIIAGYPWLGWVGTRMSLSVAAIEADGMEKEVVPEGVRAASIASLGAAIEDAVSAHAARRTPAHG